MTDQQDQFSRDLLTWYDGCKRDLPWRRLGHDPYAVWVSEIMLQQTTVAAVIPFYHKWMGRFPTVEALADAPLDDVLKFWAGLGYYARARNLHKGAQRVAAEFGGVVPSDSKTLLSLPGVGRYTAGAILSIAFNQDAPILDANVIRVMARVHAVTGDPKASTQTQAQLWRLAEEAIPSGRAGDFNQALMELGATVCNAAAPSCGTCPVEAHCRAKALGEPTAFPQFSNVKKWLDIEDVSVALRDPQRPNQTLIVQRSPDLPLWGGLWEMPRGTRQDGESLESCAARAACASVGVRVQTLRLFGVVKHVVANRRVTLHGFEAEFDGTVSADVRYAWVSTEDQTKFALATPQSKLLELLWRHDAQGRLEL